MRRALTWLLAAGVAALVVAAGVDALRSPGEPASSPEPDSPRPAAATEPGTTAAEEPAPTRSARDVSAESLRRAGVHGALTYADEECRVHVMRLPDLVERRAPGVRSCSFVVQPGGQVSFDEAAVSRDGALEARCEGDLVHVRRRGEPRRASYRGCSPAWRADGALGVVRDGEVVALTGRLDEPETVRERRVLTRADLEEGLARAGWEGYGYAVEAIAWLADGRLGAIVRAESPEETLDLLAVFSGRRLAGQPGFGYGDLGRLRASPSGRFVTAQIVDPGGLAVLDLDGRVVRPVVRHGVALAWSPDERWIASAAADGIYVFRADERTPSIYHVPIVAADLYWR